MSATLNLSNEVVKMRAEVKRVKVQIIRKLTRQIASLKKKKGKEADLERNQRRATRLLEEIKQLKALAPDSITKAALQTDISFEKVCQNKDASLSERATARVATHPGFSKKIQDIKKAITAFQVERTSAAKAETKAQKEPQDNFQQRSESEEGSDGEEDGEESVDDQDMEESGAKNRPECEGDVDPSLMVHEADTEGLSETKQEKDTSVTKKEKPSDGTPVEVVRMRKEVKKLRMLIIRKLTQQIASLRKTKGEESDLKGNQECTARLQKEVQVLRGLFPDHVTMRIIQGNINVEEVFQNPESSPLDRATARIAKHARFVKKLQDVREAIEKGETKATQADEKNNSGEDLVKVTVAEESDDEASEEDSDNEEEEEEEEHEDLHEEDASNSEAEEEDVSEEREKGKDEDKPLNVTEGSTVAEPSVGTNFPTLSPKETTKPKGDVTEQAGTPTANVKSISKPLTAELVLTLPSKAKETQAKEAPPSRQDLKTETKKPEEEGGEEESDLESSDGEEEKEYFDDSTEERFHKQSSLSEDSDEDDFFLGKVSRLKKKKSAAHGKETKSEAKTTEASNTSRDFKMQSVFCSALSKSSSTPKGKAYGPKPEHFQNQKKRPDGDVKPSWFKSQGPRRDGRSSAAGPKGPGPRQMGNQETRSGQPAFERQCAQGYKGASGRPFRPPHHSQQALHPSWEASRKRKEQQSQITAFQGKKIKFDDD